MRASLDDLIRLGSFGEIHERIVTLTRERDEAIAVAVWAARNGTSCDHNELYYYYDDNEADQYEPKVYDGTDADLYRALKEARDGQG